MFIIKIYQLKQIVRFINNSFPKEAAGIIIADKFSTNFILTFVETSTKENTWFTFRIRDGEIKKIENSISETNKRICGCFHSHTIGQASPSRLDCEAKKKIGDLWLIYSVKFLEFNLYKWNGKSFQKVSFRVQL